VVLVRAQPVEAQLGGEQQIDSLNPSPALRGSASSPNGASTHTERRSVTSSGRSRYGMKWNDVTFIRQPSHPVRIP
jgi:hypothetical protein